MTLKIYSLALLGTVIVGGYLMFTGGQPELDELLFYGVKEEPFSSTVVESGVLRSMNSITISSSLPSNRAKIITLVPEGKYVQKGELLVEFDDSPLLKDKQNAEAEIRELEGLLKQANEGIRLQNLESDKALSSIKYDIKIAQLQNRNSRQGEMLVKKREAVANLADARNEWQRSKIEYQDLKALLADGFVTKNEVEQARIKMQHAENTYQLQKKKSQVLNEIAIPAQYQKEESEISKKKKDLDRQKKVAVVASVRSQVAVERTRTKLMAMRDTLATTEKYLGEAKIRAPASGFVIFKEVPMQTERRKVHVGDSVWAHQGFIVLPDISQMAVEIRIREVDIHKVKVGQPAEIHLDSYPDLRLTGKVALIGAIAESDATYRGGKFFLTNVLIDNADQRLRPGMTARTEITTGEHVSILQVPLNAVFRKQGKDYCYVRVGDEVQLRKIKSGASNDNFIVIHSGLVSGEQVLLTEPDRLTVEK